MSADPIDVLAIAAQTLLDNSIPDPKMLLEDLDVFASLYFLQQTCDQVVRNYMGALLSSVEDGEEEPEDVVKAMAAVGLANGMVNEACVLMGLFDE
jgi:hypothetical protein